MTPPGALIVTGGVLLFLALVCAFIASEHARDGVVSRCAWLAFVLGCACFIGAAWWEAL